MKRLYKKIIVVMLVLFMVFGGVAEAEAAGAEGVVQVVGGSIAAGGIAAGVAAIAPPALIIVGLIMIGQGIDIALTEASQAEGMTKTEFLQSKFEEFCEYTKQDFERTCNTIVSGAKILADGTIWLADEAGKAVSQFINNLVANNEIVEPTVASEYVSVGGVNCPVFNPADVMEVYKDGNTIVSVRNETTNKRYAVFHSEYGGRDSLMMLSDSSYITYSVFYNGQLYARDQYITGNHLNGMYYFTPISVPANVNFYVPYITDFRSAINSMNGFDVEEGSGIYEEDTFVSAETVDTSILSPSAGSDIVIDTGIDLQGISSRYGDIGTISIDNYLDTLKQAINGVNDLTIAVQNVATGVIDDVNVGVYNPTDVAVTNQLEEDAENQIATPVIDVNSFPSGTEAQEALKGLQFDLTSIFPFCIPFDVVKIIQKFDVTPVAPHVQISVPLPGLEQNFELDIDLSGFNTVATIFRSMELVAFVVGLAIITRNLIRG